MFCVKDRNPKSDTTKVPTCQFILTSCSNCSMTTITAIHFLLPKVFLILLCFLFQVSAYHDKFVLRQLKSFIQPVIDWEAGLVGRLASIMNTNASSQFQLNFEKFVRFILHELQTNMQSYGSLHWWPFTRLCGLCHVEYDFVGKIETLEADVTHLASTKLPMYQGQIEAVFGQKINKNHDKSEKTAHLYFKQLKKDLVLELYSVYEDDFLVGGYEYPQSYLDSAS